jgi:outer membrane receptor protein involved in Fe transport
MEVNPMSMIYQQHSPRRSALSAVCATLALSLALGIVAISGISSGTAQAQAHDVHGISEQNVTVRKREELLGELSASLQVLDGDWINFQKIADLQDLSQYVPNLMYAQSSGASDLLIIRGLGTVGSGPHIEQSVSQTYNGFTRRRSRLNRTIFHDLERVEVLRGPQAPSIGKNSSLGGVNIIPNKPTRKREFSIAASHDFEYGEGFESELVASGPISSNFLGRIALKLKDKDGWVRNSGNDRELREKEQGAVRFLLNYKLADAFDIEFIYDKEEHNDLGKPREVHLCNAAYRTLAATASPSEDCKLDGIQHAGTELQNTADAPADPVVGFNASAFNRANNEAFDFKSDFYGITLSRDYGEYIFQFAHSFTDYEIYDRYDDDLTRNAAFADGLSRVADNLELYEQKTYEIRFLSEDNRIIDYVAGIQHIDSDMDYNSNLWHSIDDTAGASSDGGARREQRVDLESESLSLFGQIDWHILRNLDLSFGLRWTEEERTGAKRQSQSNYAGVDEVATCSDASTSVAHQGLYDCFSLRDTVEDDVVSFNLALEWHALEGAMFYFAVGNGFKSSGFNFDANTDFTTSTREFNYDEEETVNVEIGGKMRFGDNLFFNWTLYNTNVTDLQLQSSYITREGDAASDIVAADRYVVAGEATAQGIEYELVWGVSNDLVLGFSGAFNVTEYDDFMAPCYYSFTANAVQTEAQGCVFTAATAETGQEHLQDLSGKTLPYAPEFMFSFSLDWLFSTSIHGDWSFGFRTYHMDEYQLDVNNSPDTIQDSYAKADASVSWLSRNGRWSVSLVGRNLTDEIVANRSELSALNDISPIINDTSTLFRSAFIDQRRSLALTAKYSF